MHKYLLTRGGFREHGVWAADLSAQYLPLDVIPPGKKKAEKFLYQVGVREVKLWEITFPEECEEAICGMLKAGKTDDGYGKKWGWLVKYLRKVLKLKPPLREWTPRIIPPGHGVTVYDLGNRKDKVQWTKPDANSALTKGYTPRELI